MNEAQIVPKPGQESPKRLVLVGAGHSHLYVLEKFALLRQQAKASAGSSANGSVLPVELSLVAPSLQAIYSGMVPGWMAGHYSASQCTIEVQHWLAASGATWIQGRAVGLSPGSNTLKLATPRGELDLPYDLLSINTGGVMNKDAAEARMPGAKEHALFVRPIEGFMQLWPQLQALARRSESPKAAPFRIAIVGAGAAGVELALAVQHALPAASVTLLTGGAELAAGAAYGRGVQGQIRKALRRAGVHVLADFCVGVERTCLRLGGGSTLACDAPIVATGSQAALWWQESGLALDGAGFLAVNAYQQSLKHTNVYAVGDAASRVDRPHPRSGVYATRAGPPLAENLYRASQNLPLKSYLPTKRTLNLLSCANGTAIVSWGPFSATGAWAWRWKDRIDKRFMARFSGFLPEK